MNKNITAMVFTFNEERRLSFLYKNLKDFCEIIVFDGGSTDGTEAYCLKNNIKFILRPKNEHTQEIRQSEGMWPSILRFAYGHCSTPYVLHVFCGHLYPEKLLNEFSKVASEGKLDAVYHDVIIYRYGSIVHRPFIRRVASGCVFYKKDIIDFEGSKIHDELAIKFNDKTMLRLNAEDDLSLHLFQDECYSSFTNKTVKYAEIEAKQRFENGDNVGAFKLFLGPLVNFIYRYIRLGSIMQGVPGLVYALMNFQYDLSINIMLWEMNNGSDALGAVKKNSTVRSQLIKKDKLNNENS